MKHLLLPGIIILITLQSCSDDERDINRAVYYWRTTFELSEPDKTYLKTNGINKIYLRMFDVDWNEEINDAVPIANIDFLTNLSSDFELIPTIFITNRTLQKIPEENISQLASNIFMKINFSLEKFTELKFTEIQIDCDWTTGTADKYFELLNQIKKQVAGKTLSATIRLHQVKYFNKTGVPPGDRGMLMFYNMSSVSDVRTKNSIYDEEVAKKYLYNFDDYPLELDVALPAFSWVVLFRHKKVFALINDIDLSELNDENIFERISANMFSPKEEQFFHGEYILPEDILKTEILSPSITLSAAKLVNSYIQNKNVTVSLYHFNKELKNEYAPKDLENIFTSFN